MLKTIKTTKHMRLDELLKLCWDNHITSGIYNSNKKSSVRVFDSSNVIVSGRVSATDIFEVTYEEEITEDTKFETIFAITVEEDRPTTYVDTFRQTTIPKALRPHTSYLIAMVNDRPELIWEREEEETAYYYTQDGKVMKGTIQNEH